MTNDIFVLILEIMGCFSLNIYLLCKGEMEKWGNFIYKLLMLIMLVRIYREVVAK